MNQLALVVEYTGLPKKLAHLFCTPELRQILTNFQTYFNVRIRRTFVIIYCH